MKALSILSLVISVLQIVYCVLGVIQTEELSYGILMVFGCWFLAFSIVVTVRSFNKNDHLVVKGSE